MPRDSQFVLDQKALRMEIRRDIETPRLAKTGQSGLDERESKIIIHERRSTASSGVRGS